MTIKDKDNRIKIESIGEGMVFRYSGELLIKTEESDCEINAVCLRNGDLYDIPLDEEVEMVDCELVVK